MYITNWPKRNSEVILAILSHNWHICTVLLLKFPLSAVRNGKFQPVQEPIELLDFTFLTARENSHIKVTLWAWLSYIFHSVSILIEKKKKFDVTPADNRFLHIDIMSNIIACSFCSPENKHCGGRTMKHEFKNRTC